MKAIVILFTGDFLSTAHKADLFGTIAGIVHQTTNVEGKDNLKILNFEDVDVAKSVISKAISTEQKEKKSSIENDLEEFCREIIRKIGNPITFKNETDFKLEFVKSFLSDEQLRQNTTVLKHLLSNLKMSQPCTNVLKEYNLTNLSTYLKEINNILRFMLYGKE